MATNVNAAFSQFQANSVNLERAQTILARASRDWLAQQIATLHTTDAEFPLPYDERNIFYGSFHRSTKIRPLDDIDLIPCLHAEGSSYTSYGREVRIAVASTASRLQRFCHDGTDELNSRKVINKFVQALTTIPQYRRADIGRDGEAAVLALATYTWSFDIVPGFFTKPDVNGRSYYLIPDTNGHWKKTDPRIDQERISTINQAHGGHVLPAIRLIKYWNRRATMPTLQPYALETLVLDYYRARGERASEYIDVEVARILTSISAAIYSAVPDPKGIQGDLNHLSLAERQAVSARALRDVELATQAFAAEQNGDQRTAIRRWTEVFGAEFPTFG